MNIAFTKRSSNAKVGKIPVTTSTKTSCPPACPMLENGCYASAGFRTNMHWDKVTSGERGTPMAGLCEAVQKLPEGQLWRHNVAGDLLPREPDVIDDQSLYQLVQANKGRRGFTYTHYPMGHSGNRAAVRRANTEGFTINVSANSPQEANDLVAAHGLPTVTIVPSDYWAEGNRVGNIVRCPAETRDSVTCKSCQLCQRAGRNDIVGFTVHGAQSKKADIIARG